MSDVAIRVENLGKRYRIGVQEERQDTLVGAMLAFVKRPGRNLQRLRRLTRFSANGMEEKDVVWALRDVSFEVKQGEVVGVVGRNGAGKSTLLKVLSRITYPTTGRIELHGRVSSLLEVGTGFHPELTGRENVYLNGTILGMRKKEIDRKFDEIVDFSGVEKFIDTPVKYYSSGMRVRLAFSVAAHLEPEILLVDEVLAVGDVSFQKKSLGKMRAVSEAGRTVLFVSHNINAVNQLCSRAILLQTGNVVSYGETRKVCERYLNDSTQKQDIQTQIAQLPDDDLFRLIDFRVLGQHIGGNILKSNHPIVVEIAYELYKPMNGLRIGFDLFASDGTILLRAFDDDMEQKNRKPGIFVARAEFPSNIFNTGQYSIGVAVGIHNFRWIIYNRVSILFEVQNTGKINRHYAGGKYPGFFLLNVGWQTYKGIFKS